MKNLILVLSILLLTGCKTQNKYSDFDYSFSRSGGKPAIYENLLIKGNNAHYSFESVEKNIKQDFVISNEDLQNIETLLTQNNFRSIQEDYKKVYDQTSTSINVKNGANSRRKSDASLIVNKDMRRWQAVKNIFQNLINLNITKQDTTK